jgi:hypothetical protein
MKKNQFFPFEWLSGLAFDLSTFLYFLLGLVEDEKTGEDELESML